jgi:hypothetical protein
MAEDGQDVLMALASQSGLANKLQLPQATAIGADDTWFEVNCPTCQELTLVSLYTSDGAMCDCDACPTGQFWFYAGDFASARKRD